MSFSGTANSDFMKLASIPDRKKVEYIDYAGTDFFSLRENLISYIKAVYPDDYQNFSESDLGVMLIEVVSYMGSVLSLKGDMLANENYLRTVKNRNNLQKLLELVGVDMKGPLAAGAGARLTNTENPAASDFPFSMPAANRTIAISSKEDGAPVNYTVYKIVNNAIENIQNANADLLLNQSEVANGGATGASSIFDDVALLEGAFSTQKGTFDTLEGNKRIGLTNSPIVEGSVQVYVTTQNEDSDANGAYTQVDRLYSASGATDRVFQVVYDDDYAATVLFGDNALGISPPAGSQFTVSYRVGGGSRGNIGQGVLNVQATLLNASRAEKTYNLENRTPATGGAEAETAEHAKKYAPYTFKRQDRVVTLEDFIAIGNTFRSKQGTVGKTTAAVRDAFSSGNVIDMYVLEKADDLRLQKASPTFKKELLEEVEPKKMLTDEVVVVDGLIRTMDIVMTVRIDRELSNAQQQIEQEVAEVIRQHFNIDNADFGKPFISSELNREVFRLPNVRYATIDNLPETTEVDFNEIIQLNNFTINTVLI
jgi:predicted phage baseplate assembly protein